MLAADVGVEVANGQLMAPAPGDGVSQVVYAPRVIAEGLGVVVEVGDLFYDSGYGGCGTWVTRQSGQYVSAFSGDGWLSTQGYVEFMGVVESGVVAVGPGIRRAKLSR